MMAEARNATPSRLIFDLSIMVSDEPAAKVLGARAFYGWRVTGAAFILAVFGWGLGFYGPPVFLHAVRETGGWPLPLVSAAVTVHFLAGAVSVACLPRLYRRFGVPAITKAGAVLLTIGIVGWAAASAQWLLFAAALLSGAGWAGLGAAAINAIIAPWFVRGRPAALAMAYNGASVGGVIFSPLWVVAIAAMGFPFASAVIAIVTIVTVWIIFDGVLAKTPQQMGLKPDGDALGATSDGVAAEAAHTPSACVLWRDRRFLTLSAAMAIGLFAQIGLIAHLFSILAPAFGEPLAGVAMGGATVAAVAGRSLVGWLIPVRADRRLVACASYAVQIAGSIAFLLAAGGNLPLLILGVLLFGAGIGNATSLPPLIAQVEFSKREADRVVPFIVAIAQAAYSFAPAVFGLVWTLATEPSAPQEATPYVFVLAVTLQALAIVAMLAGRRG
jgi:MFS family permease